MAYIQIGIVTSQTVAFNTELSSKTRSICETIEYSNTRCYLAILPGSKNSIALHTFSSANDSGRKVYTAIKWLQQ